MSSSYVRTQFTTYLSTNFSSENVIDLTGKYDLLKDLLADNSLTYTSSWLGLQFIGSSEEAITVHATNNTGRYREYGTLFLHVVAPAKKTAASGILTRAEALRNSFRGKRINDIIIDRVDPPNFEDGATLQFEGGFTSCSVIVAYYRDLNL